MEKKKLLKMEKMIHRLCNLYISEKRDIHFATAKAYVMCFTEKTIRKVYEEFEVVKTAFYPRTEKRKYLSSSRLSNNNVCSH